MKLFLLIHGFLIQTALAQNPWSKYYTPMGGTSSGIFFINQWASRAGNIILLLLSGGAVIAIMYGGFKLVNSGGSDEAKESAKKIVQYALFGLLFAIMSQSIINFVSSIVTAIVN